MKDAGVVIFGRTNTPEFSMRGTTDNPLRGRTFNPWHDEASAGGSSGGAGSACAAGMGPLHHGNDIGGSLRFPSFANGTVTVKPSSFRVPTFNSTWTADRPLLSTIMSCQGVIARHAADLHVATKAMIKPDSLDPYQVPLPWEGADAPKKVAFTTESDGYPIHDDIVAMLHTAANLLRDAGYEVDEVETPSMKDAAAEWFRAGSTEMNLSLKPAIDQFGSQDIQNIFDWYFELSELLDLEGYVAAMGKRGGILRDWSLFLDQYPLVLSPFLMRPMYDWDYDARGLTEVEDLFGSAIYSTGVNYLGLPAGVIGMDLIDDRPAAIQVIGRRYREDLIVDALEAIEERNGVMAHRLWDRDA